MRMQFAPSGRPIRQNPSINRSCNFYRREPRPPHSLREWPAGRWAQAYENLSFLFLVAGRGQHFILTSHKCQGRCSHARHSWRSITWFYSKNRRCPSGAGLRPEKKLPSLSRETKMKEWRAVSEKAKAAGQSTPANSAPKEPTRPDGGYGAPANLFNGMVSPLIPYAIKGVIWYQGESNGDNMKEGVEYSILFPRMIKDWREKWAQGNFPFLFAQLPNFNAPSKTPSEGRWPWVRDAQLKTLALPNPGIAVTIDIGEANNIHPPDKLYVGRRLALAARHVVYGEDLVYSGPIYASMKLNGKKIRIKIQKCRQSINTRNTPINRRWKNISSSEGVDGLRNRRCGSEICLGKSNP